MKTNGVMMQFFHWYTPNDGNLWNEVIQKSTELSKLGISALWLPPAYKGMVGENSVGYDVYDMYDLGEFNQKGSVRTKYGTKDQYLKAIDIAHSNNIDIYADVVFNHRAGADYKERVFAQKVDNYNRNNKIGDPRIIEAWTKFTFPGRIKYNENREISDYKYSNFTWDYLCFDGVDWDEKQKENGIFLFLKFGDNWDSMPDDEMGNYDYLMFADLDIASYEVRQELKNWALWYLNFTNCNGFRLDAIKHISIEFFNEWLDTIRQQSGKELFTVGEYWQPNRPDLLTNYLHKCGFRISLFDAPLQNTFHIASKKGKEFDLTKIFDTSLVSKHPMNAVTLVDNHDTQPLQALEAPVEEWFKPIAYAFTLLRKDGYPCIFYPDLYGAQYTDKGITINLKPVDKLSKLLEARQKFNFGEQIDYFDYPSTVGWVRLGDENSQTTMAVVVCVGDLQGYKYMYVGHKFAGAIFVDYLNNSNEKVIIDLNGFGKFICEKRNVSVWILESKK